MTHSATIKLFLTTGDPKRLRTAEISNWSGKAIAAPRTEFENFLKRLETEQSGVYVLSGVSPATGEPMAYIGEAEILKSRMKGHTAKDWWVQAYAFVSKDENLTKAHIRYLEGRLIEQAKIIDRFTLDNGQSSGSKLPESDQHDMEVFLSKIVQLLPVLGSELLTPVTVDPGEQGTSEHLVCALKGVKARGQRTANGFLVFRGSQAVLNETPSAVDKQAYFVKQREELLRDGILVRNTDGLEFAKDVEFSSPSAAAAVVSGGSVNGLKVWKDETGRSLKDIEE